MPTVTFLPSEQAITVPPGFSLLDTCHCAGVGVPASCGGKGLCGKCRVKVVQGETAVDTGHLQALSPAEVAAGWRLACLIRVNEDLTIETGDGSPVRSVILTDFSGRKAETDDAVQAIGLKLPPPSLESQMCDIGRIMQGLGMKQYPDCALHLLQDVPQLLRANNFEITAVVFGRELLGIEPYREQPSVFGLAVDIGTTTIAGALFDLTTAEMLAVGSRTNPQAVRGDDVVTRIGFLRQGKGERRELQELVVGAVQEILNETCAGAGVTTSQVYIICCGGNTTMHHLLLGLDASAIAESPFVPTARRGLWNRASHVGLDAGHGAKLYTLPNISAYVGGDIVAGLLAHEVHSADKNILMIDIGTNGEMALRVNGKTYACATAAGPAFEGARISCGMRAATGAISAVTVENDDIHIATVDKASPRGLCGTGLLDAVAVLLDLGIIDETGRMLDPEEVEGLPEAIRERIIEGDNGLTFVLSGAEKDLPCIALTQRDVRELQLAKGAVAAGAAVLLGSVGLTADDLDAVLLAGGFGNYLRPASALRVGLLPAVDLEKIRFVGNAALAGTRLCLLSHSMREESEKIARETTYFELSGRSDFQMQFAEAMSFPESEAV